MTTGRAFFVVLLLMSMTSLLTAFVRYFCCVITYFFPCFSYADALLADLENTGSPLARCPVLLTSDPPKHSEAASEEPAQTRPAPPAYTPQQVEQHNLGMSGSKSWVQCSIDSLFAVFSLSDSFCCHENFPEVQPRQVVQVSKWGASGVFHRLIQRSGHKGTLAM